MSAFGPLLPTRHSQFLLVLRLLNLVIDFDGYAPVVGEVQIHYRPILELKVRRQSCAMCERELTMRVLHRRRSTTFITKSFVPPMLMS